MNRRGATITNFVLIIGLLFVALIAVVALRNLMFSTGHAAERDAAQAFVERIKSSVERANAYPTDASYEIKVPFHDLYELNISKNMISLHLRSQGFTVRTDFANPNMNVVPSRVENAGVIYVLKKQKNIYVDSKYPESHS